MNTTRLIAFLLASVFVLLSIGCKKGAQLSNFVSDGGQTYFEIKDDAGLHKVYTRENAGYRYITILDANNVPDVEAVIDSNKGNASVKEYRGEQNIAPSGLRLVDTAYMSRVGAGDEAFTRWKSKFAVFTVSGGGKNRTLKARKASATPLPVQIKGKTIIVQLDNDFDFSCDCSDVVTDQTCCIGPRCRCLAQAACRIFRCALNNNMGCYTDNVEIAINCRNLESKEAPDQGDGPLTLKDLLVAQTSGTFNLAR